MRCPHPLPTTTHMHTGTPQNSSGASTSAHSSEVLHGCRLMAASTASSSPLTAFLHRHDARGRGRARFVVAASTADAEPSPEATAASSTAGPGKKKTVDTRIHWSDPDEGWVGGKANKEGDGRKDEPLGRRFADLINNPSESHYQLSSVQQNSPCPPCPSCLKLTTPRFLWYKPGS